VVAQTEREILALCRENVAPYKVPAMIRFVPSLAVSESGKLLRHGQS
jgi:acyl-coenzyme A synthetase/AMP-(fatty) acid ligase